MDDLDRLLLFRDIVVQGGFSRAAKLRGSSLSAVSNQRKALEDELGVTLLNRTSRSMSLTDEGRLVLDDSRRHPRARSTSRCGPASETIGWDF